MGRPCRSSPPSRAASPDGCPDRAVWTINPPCIGVDAEGMDAPDVLVVDDDPDIRAMLGFTLGGEFNVRFAASGSDAIEQLATRPPDAMILDVMMPDVDGYD